MPFFLQRLIEAVRPVTREQKCCWQFGVWNCFSTRKTRKIKCPTRLYHVSGIGLTRRALGKFQETRIEGQIPFLCSNKAFARVTLICLAPMATQDSRGTWEMQLTQRASGELSNKACSRASRPYWTHVGTVILPHWRFTIQCAFRSSISRIEGPHSIASINCDGGMRMT